MAKKKGIPVVYIPILLVAGCLASMCGDGDTSSIVASSPSPTPQVIPNVVGKTVAQAESALAKQDFWVLTEALGSYCYEKTTCQVIKTSPKPGSPVKSERETVRLYYMTDEEIRFYRKHRTMPNVLRWDADKADRFFDPIEYFVRTNPKQTTSVPAGKRLIIAQSPKPGARIKLGTKITLTVGYNYSTTTGRSSYDVDSNWSVSKGRSSIGGKIRRKTRSYFRRLW